jgi:hypothetical protein
MAQQTWFVVRGGKEVGPDSGTALKDMAASGKLKPTDLVRRADVETARPASQIKGLFPAAGAGAVPSNPTQPADQPQTATNKKKLLVFGSVAADGSKGLRFATSNDACLEVHRLLKLHYGDLTVRRYRAPVYLDLHSDAAVPRGVLIRWLVRCSKLILDTTNCGEGPIIYIDDQPEMLKNIPTNVGVLLFRNGGNFDYEDRRWMLSEKTGKFVEGGSQR